MLHAHEHILGIVKLVGVQDIVLRSCSDEPYAFGRLNVHPATSSDDLVSVAVEVMIGSL